mmetsp:Transcript_2787/g.4264  ORF Transcript_2787/g.4264 Transcript_2787/m.4264 type:complete len:89 (-) Transcript_2787:107-373(-)
MRQEREREGERERDVTKSSVIYRDDREIMIPPPNRTPTTIIIVFSIPHSFFTSKTPSSYGWQVSRQRSLGMHINVTSNAECEQAVWGK